jgi:hypothetical protein
MYKMQQKPPYEERRTRLRNMQESFNSDWNARFALVNPKISVIVVGI